MQVGLGSTFTFLTKTATFRTSCDFGLNSKTQLSICCANNYIRPLEMTMRSTETRRHRGIRRSWLAIGLVTTTLHGVQAGMATATISQEPNNSEPLILMRNRGGQTTIQRQQRTRTAEIRELGTISNNQDYYSMMDESFEIMFRDFPFSMSIVPVRNHRHQLPFPVLTKPTN